MHWRGDASLVPVLKGNDGQSRANADTRGLTRAPNNLHFATSRDFLGTTPGRFVARRSEAVPKHCFLRPRRAGVADPGLPTPR